MKSIKEWHLSYASRLSARQYDDDQNLAGSKTVPSLNEILSAKIPCIACIFQGPRTSQDDKCRLGPHPHCGKCSRPKETTTNQKKLAAHVQIWSRMETAHIGEAGDHPALLMRSSSAEAMVGGDL